MDSLNLAQQIDPREYESHLCDLANEHPDDVFNWFVARTMSKDLFIQNFLLMQMMACIKRTQGVHSYLKGIMYTHNIGRSDLNRELSDELIEQHPVAGRLYKLMFTLPPQCLVYNPFD